MSAPHHVVSADRAQGGSTETLRHRVLVTLSAKSDEWMLAKDVAENSGMTYDQAIFALNALYNHGRVARLGKKRTAQWKVSAKKDEPIRELEKLFRKGF